MAGEKSLAMVDELGIRISDPAHTAFPINAKLRILDKAQIQLMDYLEPKYLTEFETTQENIQIPSGYVEMSNLNSGNVFKGAQGILRVVLKTGTVVRVQLQYDDGTLMYYDDGEPMYSDDTITQAGTSVQAIRVKPEDLKEIKNPYFAYSDERPYYYVEEGRVFVLCDTYAGTVVDVSYLKLPSAISSSADTLINDTFHGIIITLAEALAWSMDERMDVKLERKEASMRFAMQQIESLNTVKMFFDKGNVIEPNWFDLPRTKPVKYFRRFHNGRIGN